MHYKGSYSVFTRERVWIRRARERGVEGVAVKTEVKTVILPLVSTTSSPLKTQRDGEEKWRDSITQQEIWTWAVYLAWPIGWSISKQEMNAAYCQSYRKWIYRRSRKLSGAYCWTFEWTSSVFARSLVLFSFTLALLICSPLQNDSRCLL